MSYASRSLSITVSGYPSWWPAIADRTWTKVATGAGSGYRSGATLNQAAYSPGAPDNVAPGLFAYSGAVVDQSRGEFIAHGGGHGARNGNEPYALALRSETPGWRYLCAPSGGAYSGGNTYAGRNGAGQYDADYGRSGAPQSSHTYNRMAFANDRLWLPGLAAMQYSVAGASQSTSRVFSFDRLELRWRAHGHIQTDQEAQQFNGGFCEDTSAVYVPADEIVWTHFRSKSGSGAATTIAGIDARNGDVRYAYTSAQTSGWGEEIVGTNIPGTRYVLLRGHCTGSYWGLFLWSSASPTSPVYLSQLTVSDTTGGADWSNYAWGQVWHAASGALLVSAGQGANFVKIAPNTPGNYTGAWTASLVTPAATTDATPANSSNQTYGRWNIVNDMGDGRSAIVFLPYEGQTSPTYVYALPAAGV